MTTRPSAHFVPLVKWTGSKRSQAAEIVRRFPRDFVTYYEPFVGGASVAYQAAPPKAVCADILDPLIELWRVVQDRPHEVAERYCREWERLQRHGHEAFYDVRDRFNANPNPFDLLFLSRTCVNGLIRFNKKGEFNNSFHLTRPGIHPDRLRSIVLDWSARLAHVDFRCGDYRETTAGATKHDFVYLDPPYFNTRGRYFGRIQFDGFLDYLHRLRRRGIRYALSYDGNRAGVDYSVDLPRSLYERRLLIPSGNSPFRKVMGKKAEMVEESLYLSWK